MSPQNQFTKTTTIGYGQKIKSAFAGILIGLILFLASFAVLWWNEGRTDMSKVAALSETTSADKIDSSKNGKFVSITGTMNVEGEIGDPEFLAAGPYISLQRNVEMYAWVEEKQTKREDKVGGKSEETTTYNYEKKWTSSPESSSSFEYPNGHENPELPYKSQSWYAEQAKIGAYTFSPGSASIPSGETLALDANMIQMPQTEAGYIPVTREGNYLYIGEGSSSKPEIGDVKISYKALRGGKKATIFGTLNGSTVEPYVHKGKDRLFRVSYGTRDEVIANMRTEHKTIGWILRIVGFFMMWIGMGMFFGPIHAILQVLPFLSSASRAIVGLLLFPVALVLTILTIIISMIAHNIIALIITVVIIVGGIVAFILLRKKKATA